MSKVILVASGKGGVGKSTVSAACATALAKQNKKTLLIDGDIGLRSLDILLGVSDRVVYDWSDAIKGRATYEDVITDTGLCESGGPWLAPAPTDMIYPTEASFRKLIGHYIDSFDFIIIDAPAGVGGILEVYAKSAMYGIVVATSDAASVRSAYTAGNMLYKYGMREIRLIINKVNAEGIRSGKMPNPDEIIDKSEIRLIGAVPYSAAAERSAIGGRLDFGNDKTINRAFENIALRLTGKSVRLTKM